MALFIFTKNTTGGNSLNTESVALRGFEPNLNRNNLGYMVNEWNAPNNDFHNIILNANLSDLPASSTISAIRIKLYQVSNIGTSSSLIARTLLRAFTQTTATWDNFTTASPWTVAGGAYNAADADINTANQSSVARDGLNNASYITLTLSATQIANAQAAYGGGGKLNLILSTTFLTSAGNETVYGAPWGTDGQRPIIEIDYTTGVINNPPVNTVPATQNAGVNVYKEILGISVNDSNNNLASVKLTATNATINVNIASGATISAGAQNTGSLTLSGTQTQINAALANVGYIGTVVGTQTLTVLSTDSTGTPLTDTDVISITVKDAYAVDNTVFDVTGVLSNSVALTPSKQWTLPTGVATWTFTVEKLSSQHTAPIQLNIQSVSSSAFSTALNPATDIFITEASYGLLSPAQRTATETGGGHPLFVVTKNAGDTSNAFDVTMSLTKDGVYSTYLTNQAFTPTALVTGIIDKTHPTFAITNESNMPNTITADTKGLLYDSIGQREWVQLNSLTTKTILGETARVFEGVGAAIWDSGMPIQVGQEDVARVAVLTAPSIGAIIADGVQRFFKVIPKIIGGATINPALVTPVALTIASKSRRPYNVRKVIFVRNETPEHGSSFPDGNIDQGATNIYYYPSSRTEAVTSNFTSPAPAFETGVTVHVDVKTVGGETLIRTINGGTIDAHYSETNRAADIARYSTQYEVYTKKNGFESERFIWVVQQQIPQNNTVTAVTPTFLSGNVRTNVQLAATAGGTAGTGQETGVYLVRLSGTLFPTINMDSMSIDAGAATILSYDKTKGELLVVAPRALAAFTLITPYTGSGSITVFAGYRFETWPGDVGLTSTATI